MTDLDAIAIFYWAIEKTRDEYRYWPAEEWVYCLMAREIEHVCFEEGVAMSCAYEVTPSGVRFVGTLKASIKSIKIESIVV